MATKAWTDKIYTVSDHARIPASAYWYTAMRKDRKLKVYDTLQSGHWIKTYCGGTFKQEKAEADLAKHTLLADAGKELKNWLLKPPTGDGPEKLKGHNLYKAAESVKKGLPATPSKGAAKGLERALRYYMLATYSLIDVLAIEGKSDKVNNYVAAMLVDASGKILSVGINTGSFMHAEVSMLLSYFLNNPGQSKLPDESLVFSTLTPCMQCTKFLMESRSAKTLMYYGQADLGEFGNIGSLDVAGFKKVVGEDTKKEYDIDYLKGMPEDEAMTLPALFGRPPKVYNVNQGDINEVKKFISAEKDERAKLKTPAYDKLTTLDYKGTKDKVSNTAGQLKDKPDAKGVFTHSRDTLAVKARQAAEKGKDAKGDDAEFRGLQSSVLDYLERSLKQVAFYN